MKLLGTVIGCNVTEILGKWYRIGKLVCFSMDLYFGNNGTDQNTYIQIPCLPYKPEKHCIFQIGYCTVQIKYNGNGTDSVPTIPYYAAAYTDSNEIYLGYSYGNRNWRCTQKDIISGSGVAVISGTYIGMA